jgi:hypothetical protein
MIEKCIAKFSRNHYRKKSNLIDTGNHYKVDMTKVNRDRYNIDEPGCKKKAGMDLDLRTWNDKERFSESILDSS